MTGWGATGADDADRVYRDAATWLVEWFSVRYCRSWDSGGRVWCPEWREHPEADSRIEGLWQAWERLHGRDIGRWWLDHCDPTMAALTDDRGPFSACRNGHRDRLKPLPTC